MGGIVEGAIALGAAVAEGASAAAGAVASSAGAIAAGTATIADIALVSTVVGTGLGIVGAATGNQTLGQIGLGLGVAGGITGLAAAGGLFDAATTAATEGSYTTATPGWSMELGTPPPVGTTAPSVTGTSIAGEVAKTGDVPAQIGEAAPVEGSNLKGLVADYKAANPIAAQAGTGLTAAGNPVGTPEQGISTISQGSATPAPPAPGAPGAPQPAATPEAPAAPGTSPSLTGPQPVDMTSPSFTTYTHPPSGWSMQDLNQILKNSSPDTLKTWWNSQSPSMQAAIAMTAGQGAAGLAGGLFQGVSAEQQLALQRLIQAQNQGQMQYLNRNNAYAPQISFQPTGLMAGRTS